VCPPPLFTVAEQLPSPRFSPGQASQLSSLRALSNFPSRFPSTGLSPHGSRTRLSHLRFFTRPQLRVGSGLPTTPVHFGWTEPPDRHPPASGPSTLRVSPGCLTDFPSRIPLPAPFPSRFLDSVEPRYGFLGRSSGRALACPRPCSLWQNSAPDRLTSSIRTLSLSSFPGTVEFRLSVPFDRPFPSRFPDSAEPSCGAHSAATPGGLWSAHHPCPFRLDRAP